MVRVCFTAPSHAGLPSVSHSFCGLEFLTFRALLLTTFIAYRWRGQSRGLRRLLYVGTERGGALRLCPII